jgi:AcrR family transcriptional regulator
VSKDSSTKIRILLAAAELLAASPGMPIAIGQIAERAGISRQALYLHFADRAKLFIELTRWIDQRYRTPLRQEQVDRAATALLALEESVRLQAFLKPRLRGIANALDALRRSDDAAAAAWNERETERLKRCRTLVERLADEGRLAKSLDAETASKLMWAVTSQRMWEDLVVDQHFTAPQYVAHITHLLTTALVDKGTSGKEPNPAKSTPGRALRSTARVARTGSRSPARPAERK